MSSRIIEKEISKHHSENGTPNPADIDEDGGNDDVRDEPQEEEHNESDEIKKLRRILVRSTEVGDVLPEAVKESTRKTSKLARATRPLIEENIRQSAESNPRILAEALFPVIGPAIRKAIAEALSAMIQSFNQTLEHSVSPKGISWRFEAWRTGKSFGEIVMLRTLLYRVEQVFLIYNENGILLQHVAANPNDTKDADMVSAMLTAIRDFVRDSFETKDGATLDALRMEEVSVWIEHGPDALLAVVIRGNPPLSLRDTFSEAIEEIHYNFEDELESFQGDTDTFRRTKPILESCITSKSATQAAPEEDSPFSPVKLLALALGSVLIFATIFFGIKFWNWSNFVSLVKEEPGFVVTSSEFGFFQHSIEGLRDPLARKSIELSDEFGYDSGQVEFNFSPFVDADGKFILMRANRLLKPPKGVSLAYDDGALIVNGNPSSEWLERSQTLALAIGGVNELRLSTDGGDNIARMLANQKIEFVCNSAVPTRAGQEQIQKVGLDIEKIAQSSTTSSVAIKGYSSGNGTTSANEEISMKRAEAVRESLLAQSDVIRKRVKAQPNFLEVKASGISDNEANCEVGFEVKDG